VNCIEFGCGKAGFILAAGLESGNVAIVYKQLKNFEVYEKIAAASPISSLSWAPYTTPEDLCSEDAPSESLRLQFITVSYDSQAIIWEYNPKKQEQISMVGPLPAPSKRGSLHSVSWCKNIGIPYDLIAIGCELEKVEIYTKLPGKEWETSIIHSDLPVWHVGWSKIGCVLSFHTSKNTNYAVVH
jgi:WD40 repeat protein